MFSSCGLIVYWFRLVVLVVALIVLLIAVLSVSVLSWLLLTGWAAFDLVGFSGCVC